MKKFNAKKLIIPGVYLTAALLVISSIYVTVSGINNYFKEKENFNYSIDGMTKTPDFPVQAEDKNTTTVIIRPYKSDKVSIGREFYDYEGSEESQQNAIIFYENTYMQNTGVDYISDEKFEVISVLPGKIISINKDEVLGNIVKVEHDKDIVSVYQGIDEILVKQGDTVKQGVVIGSSATSNINPNFKNSFHFEIYYKGEIKNPETFYTQNINNL